MILIRFLSRNRRHPGLVIGPIAASVIAYRQFIVRTQKAMQRSVVDAGELLQRFAVQPDGAAMTAVMPITTSGMDRRPRRRAESALA